MKIPSSRAACPSLHILISLALLSQGCSDSSDPGKKADLGGSDITVNKASPRKGSCKVDNLGSIGIQRPYVMEGSSEPSDSVPLSRGQAAAVGALQYKTGLLTSQGCSGTLVADRMVLTAGHCVTDFYLWDGDPATLDQYLYKPSEISFIVGPDIRKPRHVFAVEKILVVPSFTNIFAAKIEHDLALLTLKGSAKAAVPEIEPIPFNDRPLDQGLLGQPVLSGGYGSLNCGDYEFSPERYWAELQLTAVLPEDLMFKDVSNGSPVKGDSGAGLLMMVEGKARVVAVVSVGLDQKCLDHAGPRLDVTRAWWGAQGATPCGTVPPEGRCEGDRATWCEGGEPALMDCAAAGARCGKDACGLNRCVTAPVEVDPECESLDYMGRCAGAVLEWCLEGKLQRRDCAADGQTCGHSADPLVGHNCLDGAPADAGPGDSEPDTRVDNALTCEELQLCLMDCGYDDYGCTADCTSRTTTATKVSYSAMANCQYCSYSKDPDHCDVNATGYSKCVDICRGQTPECEACVSSACAAEDTACEGS